MFNLNLLREERDMKILIVRTGGDILNTSNYNSQEIGLAKALLDLGNTCDIVYFNGKNPSRVEEIHHNGKIIKIYWEHGLSVALNGIFPNINRLLPSYDVIQTIEYDQYIMKQLFGIFDCFSDGCFF